MKNYKEIYQSLPENEKLLLIEKVMPYSGTHRQLEKQGSFSDGQIKEMAELFFNSINWEKGEGMEEIDIHDKMCLVNGVGESGNIYEAVGYYSCNDLLYIYDLEIKNN